MDNALNEKLDLSALHLGIISVGALLGAVVTLVVCILAVRIITVLLRRVLARPRWSSGSANTSSAPCGSCCGW